MDHIQHSYYHESNDYSDCGKSICTCDEIHIIIDITSGDIVCTSCGIVKDERILSYQPEYDEDNNIVTMENSKDEYFENKHLTTKMSKYMGMITKIQEQQSISQKQMFRNKEFDEITSLCERLQTTDVVATNAKHHFNDLCKKKIFRGANRKAMMACCIIQSLYGNGVSRDISEICDVCCVKKCLLTKNIPIYEKIQQTKLFQEHNSSEIYRYLQRMGVPTKDVYTVSNQVIRQQQYMMNQRIYQGKSPRIILAIILKNMNFDRRVICEGLNVSITAF